MTLVVAWLVAVILILCFMAGATWDDDDYLRRVRAVREVTS